MNNKTLADLLFPHIDKTHDDYAALYPPRKLPQGARVTRLGPSPTGFIHLGNLYGAFADERLAHQSGGVFYLRIEDTDEKREVEGAVEAILSALDYFGLHFDEGATLDGDSGEYGPYYQSQRALIYQSYAKHLILCGEAYPCFCTEDELASIRSAQEGSGDNPGYYGTWARCRDLALEEIQEQIENDVPYVIRLRSQGDAARYFHIEDGVKDKLTLFKLAV